MWGSGVRAGSAVRPREAAPREWWVVVDEYAQEFPCDGDPAGARDDWGGIERVEREWDLGA